MMKAKMTAADVRRCRHYGKRGRKGDQERRMVKRSENAKFKKSLRNGRDY